LQNAKSQLSCYGFVNSGTPSKQRSDLFADLSKIHDLKQDHFLATIVCLARETKQIVADEFQVVDVVDGQQRITTLIILMKSIELTLSSNNKNEKKIRAEFQELFVKNDDYSIILLQTNHDSSNIFSEYLKRGKILKKKIQIESDKNLVDAMNECQKFVEQWKDSNKLGDLVAILKNRLSVIYHEMTDEAVVYRVFEVLNSRGLDVRWIDKLKSQLMGLIFLHAEDGSRNDAVQEMHEIWKGIYQALGLNSSMGDEALRFAGTLFSDEYPSKLLSQSDATEVLVAKAGNKLEDIVSIAKWLADVIDESNKIDSDHRLRAVSRVINSRFVAISILLREFPTKEEKKLLRLWENLSFRIYGLDRADARFKVGEFVRLGYNVINKELSVDDIIGELLRIGKDYPIDIVTGNLHNEDCYKSWREELRYLLFRYEEQQAREAGEKLNAGQWNKIWAQDPSKSIEHIKPQNSGLKYIHHLGNLTLLPPGVNSSLQDKSPNDKAETYEACGLQITRDVGSTINQAKKWGANDVKSRSHKIVEFVREEWAD